jgi:hypothetical protein
VGRHAPSSWKEGAPGWAPGALMIARVLLVLAAIATVVVVIQAGHTGAGAVWSNYPNLRP